LVGFSFPLLKTASGIFSLATFITSSPPASSSVSAPEKACCVYDIASGSTVWTKFDPLGLSELSINEDGSIAVSFGGLPVATVQKTDPEFRTFQKEAYKQHGVDLIVADEPADSALIMGIVAAGAVAIKEGLSLLADHALEGQSAKDIVDQQGGGAQDAPLKPTTEDSKEWIYGPRDDTKINDDGSTSPDTWSTPDEFEGGGEATDKLDPFKPMEGRRPATIPKGTPVQRGITPGGEGPYNGDGGANETLTPGGLPPGSVGEFEEFTND
jgi:hypothetical protein